jgi:uncharacterized protein YndB with AHSA1/START domain
MASDAGPRILGSLRIVNGQGVVRIEDRFEADVDELWLALALTEPARLAGWYGEVNGAPRLGGNVQIHIEASGWEGTGRVEACEPSRRLVVTTRETDESSQRGVGAPPFDSHIEALLHAGGDMSDLVLEVRGFPVDKLATYGVGWQIHVEDLGAYIAGRRLPDAEARWTTLAPHYHQLAMDLAE